MAPKKKLWPKTQVQKRHLGHAVRKAPASEGGRYTGEARGHRLKPVLLSRREKRSLVAGEEAA
jgi:hypothetical protein